MGLIVARPRIESLETVKATLPEGLTLRQQVEYLQLAPEVWTDGVAFIGEVREGAEIYPDSWHLIRPKPGLPVNVFIVPGGSGFKDIFSSILPIALLAAQIAVAGLPGGAFLSAGIGLAGNFLMQKLAPKAETPKAPKAPRQLGQAGFAGNVLKAYEQIPTVLGRKRVPPNHLFPPWVELNGELATVRGVVGLAGRHYGDDIRVNGALDVDGVRTVFRQGAESDGDLQICTVTAWQRQGREMPRHVTKVYGDNQGFLLYHTPDLAAVTANDLPREIKYRIGDSPDRVVMDFQFPQGLYSTSTPATEEVGIPFRFVLYAEDGSGDTFVLPQCDCVGIYQTPFRVKVVIEFDPGPAGLVPHFNGQLWHDGWSNNLNQQHFGQQAYTAYFGTGPYADHVDLNSETMTATIYLDPAVFGQRKWSLGIKAGSGFVGSAVEDEDGTYMGGAFSDFFGANLFGGHYYSTEDYGRVQSQCVLEYITSIWDEPPFDPTGLCTLEIEAKNVQVDSVTFIAERYVEMAWDGAAFSVLPQVTSIPGNLMYEVLTNADLNARPLPLPVIDAAALGDWVDWTVANGLECNAYIESGTVEDALNVIANAGDFVLRRSETWGGYIERDRTGETPVQVYSPRNSRNFQAERRFDNYPHAFTVTFDDEDDENQTREITVYHDDYDVSTASDVLARNYPGITNEDQVREKALHELRAIRMRANIYTLETDPQWMVSPRGSLVGVSSDVIDQLYGRARIVRVDRQDVAGVPKIVAVAVDDELPLLGGGTSDLFEVPDIFAIPDIFDLGEPTGIAVQARDGTIVTGETSQGGRQKYITFTTPLDDDADILPGCKIYSGQIGQVYRLMIVLDVTPGAKMTARLTLCDRASEIFA